MALNQKQKLGAKYIAEGYSKAEVSRLCKVNPKTVYNWLSMVDFNAEVDRLKAIAEKEIVDATRDRMELLFDNLLDLALKSKNDSVKYNATTYLIDRQLGKPTVKTEDVSTNKSSDDVEDIDSMLEQLDNVIDLREVNTK